MRRIALTLLLALAPAYLAAQSGPKDRGEHRGDRSAAKPDGRPELMGQFSVKAQARLEAMLRAARDQDLPTEPMLHRMREGRAKGASEGRIIAATAKVKQELETAQEVFIRAHHRPKHHHIRKGAWFLAQVGTAAKLEAFVRKAKAKGGLDHAFEVLTELAARGIPVTQALAVVEANLRGSSASQATSASSGVSASAPGVGATLGSQASTAAKATTTPTQTTATLGSQLSGSTSLGTGKTSVSSTATSTLSSTVKVGLGKKP